MLADLSALGSRHPGHATSHNPNDAPPVRLGVWVLRWTGSDRKWDTPSDHTVDFVGFLPGSDELEYLDDFKD